MNQKPSIHTLYTQSLCEVIIENQVLIMQKLGILTTKEDVILEVKKRSKELRSRYDL
jgi:hypothetical protein